MDRVYWWIKCRCRV